MKITAVRAIPIQGSVRDDVAIVSSLGSHLVGHYVLAIVETDAGVRGLGEATVTAVWSGETQTGACALIEKTLAPAMIGADPFDVAWLERRLAGLAHANPFARGAVEMALLDLQGRSLQAPVYQLLGGRNPERSDIRLKFVVGAEAPAIAAERAGSMVAAGWKAIKVKVGKSGHPAIDFERLRAVREAIGPNVWLAVDANGAFAVADAVWLARRLETLDVQLFEQPTARGRHREMREVRRRVDMPIMADESVFSLADAIEILRAEAADVLSVYPGKSAGLRETQAIVRLAEAHGVPCTIGSNLEREIATAAMAHLVVATPNLHCERYPGDLIGPLYFTDSLTSAPLDYDVDRLRPPTGPGLGVTMDMIL